MNDIVNEAQSTRDPSQPFGVTYAKIVETLADPAVYPDRTQAVDVRETHISKVFLTDRFAYKLKKPVRYDFLDFSTLAKRQLACQQELKLNRRLAEDVYLAIVPITKSPHQRIQIGGDGRVVEWLVKMRRLDDQLTLKSMLRKQCLGATHVENLAATLARFYTSQAPAVVKADEYVAALWRHIRANDAELQRVFAFHSARYGEEASLAQIRFTTSAQLRFARFHDKLFHDRVCDGRIVDGHGDLRPDHIYFEHEPKIIDCIEFNSEYRQNDILDELAFLAMECDHLGDGQVGEIVLDEYRRSNQDDAAQSLVDFYKSYRAMVRAKVRALQIEQHSATGRRKILESALSYLHLAHRYAQRLGPRLLISVGGLMGSGKSTLANQLANDFSGERLATDSIRQEHFSPDGKLAYGDGKYSPEHRQRVYQAMFEQVPAVFQETPTVILDGTFGRRLLRKRVDETAHQLGTEQLHVECECPSSVAIARLASRQSAETDSEGRSDLYQQQQADYEVCQRSEHVVRVDTTLPLSQQVSIVQNRVREMLA